MINKQELMDALRDPEIATFLHRLSDLDRSTKSQHHTLGKQVNQAAPGQHFHNDKDSPALLSDYLRYDGFLRTATASATAVTTDVNGEAVIAHNLADMHGNQLTPFVIVGTDWLSTQSRAVQNGNYTSTTFTIRAWITSTGARLANTGITYRWIAIG